MTEPTKNYVFRFSPEEEAKINLALAGIGIAAFMAWRYFTK